MLPPPVEEPLSDYLRNLERHSTGAVEAVYLVGGAALGDFSLRQSNLDLVVVVSDREVLGADPAQLRRAERSLERVGRPPGVWYATWDDIAEGPPAGGGGSAPEGPEPGPAGLDTPLTRGLLVEEAIALRGPDWPVVAYDEAEFRLWCKRRLDALASASKGLMVMRRTVAPLVLEAARLAEGAVTGRVMSKSQAGEAALGLVPNHYRRILNDAVGYRRGASTSNYWGPFERKTDALEVIRHLVKAVQG